MDQENAVPQKLSWWCFISLLYIFAAHYWGNFEQIFLLKFQRIGIMKSLLFLFGMKQMIKSKDIIASQKKLKENYQR